MKRLLALLLLFYSQFLVAKSATSHDFAINSLPATVTNQWKYHAGDSKVWADTSFNDRGWSYIDASQAQHFLPQVEQARIGWFRLTINVVPEFRKKTIALTINQSGAAEIYFNGILIRTMGRFSANDHTVQTYYSVNEPLTIQLNGNGKQYIAVKYLLPRTNLVIGYGRPVITARFDNVESAWDRFYFRVDFYTTRAWVSGGCMLLGILQLAIYFFNRKRKVNLYLSLYAFLQLFTLIDGLLSPMLRTTGWYNFDLTVFNIAAPLTCIFQIMMTYAFFNYPRGHWFKFMAALCLPAIILQFFYGNAENQYLLAVFCILCYLTILHVLSKAIRDGKTGAKLFLVGIVTSMVFYILFNIQDLINQPILVVDIEVALAFITPAIILAILLAREFAQNLIALRFKLDEVETLSARNLQQEIEKQQILASQNELLENQVNERTEALQQSLNHLKATQTQLIQSEKMASLGELTAGIAHEIQNPLNFVNNFSEVNKEMIDELEDELKTGNIDEALSIAADIKQNEEKINHHGKRADAIVKGMLEHSRASSGTKEPTDINKLADEYLRLSYHGLRAKDRTFNASLVTNFDEKLPLINVIPQDIGRVLLNLFNNAFYAVNQKQKTGDADYQPQVVVTTSIENNQVIIKVKDNGIGIPDAIKDKIMQPFFTTKPTGEGTGLGLSLTYDMVVKGHGGKIEVESKIGESTTFIIKLPLT